MNINGAGRGIAACSYVAELYAVVGVRRHDDVFHHRVELDIPADGRDNNEKHQAHTCGTRLCLSSTSQLFLTVFLSSSTKSMFIR